MERLIKDFPLRHGRKHLLDIKWYKQAQATGATQEAGAAMPEYGWSQSASTEASLTLTGNFTIPADATGCFYLRLDSVGCHAKLWLNGKEAATHIGSHTVWEVPLDAKPGQQVDIKLELENGENLFSPYQVAGILRGLYFVEAPKDSALLVNAYAKDSKGIMELAYAPGLQEVVELYDVKGEKIGQWPLSSKIENLDIALWDAEHPNLYTLKIGKLEKKIGFAEVTMADPQILWNGKPLKLRGINYREPLPIEGHDIKADLIKLKQANINFLRSMYYPYTEELLSLCDEMGFYVEQCAPFQDVGQGIAHTQNAPAEAAGFLSQFAEMLRDGISHPSVAIWFLGGDASWGSNFRNCYRLAKEIDPRRPVNFFHPMTVPEEEPEMDIWSVSFVDWRQPMDEHYDQMVIFHTQGADNEIGYEVGGAPDSNKPVLHHIFAPPAVYNRDEYEKDYGIREFWGQGIKRFWDKMWSTKGCLGGAILAATDEDGTFSPRLEKFNWGILDAQHNPKPEYHHVRMAYAPVVVESVIGPEIKIRNRYCHTDLSEINCHWEAGEESGILKLSAEPGGLAIFTIPAKDNISLFIGEHKIILNTKPPLPKQEKKVNNGGKYKIVNSSARFIFMHNDLYSFAFSSGLLYQASIKGKDIVSGPYLQATRLTLEEWNGIVENITITNDSAHVILVGAYGDVCRVKFDILIGNDGTISTTADILSLNKPMPHSVKAGVGVDPGGLNEWGIAWQVGPGSESLYWHRNALWDWYPEDHIGRPVGEAKRGNLKDFTSMKHHINRARLSYQNMGIEIYNDDEDISIRLEEDDELLNVFDDREEEIIYTGHWHKMDDYCGNFKGTESLSDEPGATATFNFTGTGVRVYGPKDFLYGEGEVNLDGGKAVPFCQYMDKVDIPGASRGYEKRYNQLLFEARDLADGPHTLCITVKGKAPAGAQGCYVSIDRIVVEKSGEDRPVRLVLNRDFNYCRLVRGNYMRPPVLFDVGSSISATIRLYADEGGQK